VISGFVSGVAQPANPTNTGANAVALYDQMPNSLAYASGYTVDNQACRPNTAPTAVLTASPTSGFAPLTVTFDGSGSSDPDTAAPADTIASYRFDFGDGTSTTQSTPTTTHSYANPGAYSAALTVTDSRGAVSTNSAQQIITVNGQPDLIVSNLVASNSNPKLNEKVKFSATITNIGKTQALASKTQFLLDGTTQIGLIDTPLLAPGASAPVSVTWTAKAKRGTHTIKATADKTTLVSESNETNNDKSITISIL
nr:PKD domain-containing protein [Pyrinomonadaceae bacterium]